MAITPETFSGKDLRTALTLLGTFTAAAAKEYVSASVLMTNLQSAATGVVTLAWSVTRSGGSESDKTANQVALSKATGTGIVASNSIVALPLQAGDVIKVYGLTGNASDSSISGTVYWSEPDAVSVAGMAQEESVQTLISRLTSDRATKLDNLDVAVSTRSTLTSNDIPEVSPDAIRGALGMAEANLDEQLGNVPTNDEFEARTLPSAEYNRRAAGNVSVTYDVGLANVEVTIRGVNDPDGEIIQTIHSGNDGTIQHYWPNNTYVYYWRSRPNTAFTNPEIRMVAE